LLEVATVGWNVLEGVIALAAGLAASSVALVGFGVDSFIETASGLVVGWRLREEMRGGSEARGEELERRASRVAGILLMMLAVYLLVDSGRRLLGFGGEARESVLGVALTAISLVLMPALGWAKLKTADALASGALRADAYETIACAFLSLTTLIGLGLNAGFGWWWADPAAALLLVPLIGREAWEALGEAERAA
jgi:divalent metal cation (Fe/Co/Zn/Cd) transporter